MDTPGSDECLALLLCYLPLERHWYVRYRGMEVNETRQIVLIKCGESKGTGTKRTRIRH